MQDAQLEQLAATTGNLLHQKGRRMACAESCTGGWIAKLITDIPGSSQWFERGFVTYSNQAKIDLLGVRPDTLNMFGAVSEQVALQMVCGALKNSQSDVAVAVTGIAGPDGGTPLKPVGTVWLAWANSRCTRSERYWFPGNRDAVRRQTVARALQILAETVS